MTLRTVEPTRLLCPRNSPGKNAGVGSHSPLQGSPPDPGTEAGSPALQAESLSSEIPGKPTVRGKHLDLFTTTHSQQSRQYLEDSTERTTQYLYLLPNSCLSTSPPKNKQNQKVINSYWSQNSKQLLWKSVQGTWSIVWQKIGYVTTPPDCLWPPCIILVDFPQQTQTLAH